MKLSKKFFFVLQWMHIATREENQKQDDNALRRKRKEKLTPSPILSHNQSLRRPPKSVRRNLILSSSTNVSSPLLPDASRNVSGDINLEEGVSFPYLSTCYPRIKSTTRTNKNERVSHRCCCQLSPDKQSRAFFSFFFLALLLAANARHVHIEFHIFANEKRQAVFVSQRINCRKKIRIDIERRFR